MDDSIPVINRLWFLAFAHVAIYAVICRSVVDWTRGVTPLTTLSVRPCNLTPSAAAGNSSAFAFAVFGAAATAFPIILPCEPGSRACEPAAALTLSRMVSDWPRYAIFGCFALATGIAGAAALATNARSPRIGVLLLVSMAGIGASPDIGGGWSTAHTAFLSAIGACSILIALNAQASRSRLAIMRAHVAASAAFGVAAVYFAYRTDQSARTRSLSFSSEVASFLHACVSLA